MSPLTFLVTSKDETAKLMVQLMRSPSRTLVEAALFRREVNQTFPEHSIASRWINRDPQPFLDLYPDVVTFLRDHQANPSTVHILESVGVMDAIRAEDLVDTFRRIILRHLPVGHSWFMSLHEALPTDPQVFVMLREWLDGRLQSPYDDSARSFFSRYAAAEIELRPNMRDMTVPANYRLRGHRSVLWQILSPQQLADAIRLIIRHGNGMVIAKNWMIIRVWLIDHPDLVTQIKAALPDEIRASLTSPPNSCG